MSKEEKLAQMKRELAAMERECEKLFKEEAERLATTRWTFQY